MVDARRSLIGYLSFFALLLIVGAGCAPMDAPPQDARAGAYEVWAIDQSDSSKDGGGTLYIYDGAALATDVTTAKAEMVDLGGKFAEACKGTGSYPKRPHMILFTKDGHYGIISYVASGHVVFVEAVSRTPIGCVSLGKNAHAAFPTADMKMALGANIAEKKLVRIWTDYARKQFIINPEQDVVALSTLEPTLPDASPICPVTDNSSRFVFVTPRGGGLAVYDITATPMALQGTLPPTVVEPAGCGGVQIGATMYLNSGGGWPVMPLNHDVYAFPLNALPKVPAPTRIGGRDGGDAHGMVAVKNRYLWSGDRHLNTIDVYDTSAANRQAGTITLVGDLSKDPAPDLMDAAPDGHYVFVTLRGPSPLTGNHRDVDNAVGSTPGVGVITVESDGKAGTLIGIAPINGDPHGIQVRKR